MHRKARCAVVGQNVRVMMLCALVAMIVACAGRAASSDSSDGAMLTAADAAAALEKCCGDSAIGVGLRIAADYKEPSITTRRFTSEQFWQAVQPMAEYARFNVSMVGRSAQGRPLRTITIGSGPTTILVWSRMNTDQSTGTLALADIVRWFANTRAEDRDVALRQRLLSELTIVLLPILNPDDAEPFVSGGANEVAPVADAARLSPLEAQVLDSLRGKLQPEFGLYLIDDSVHDTTRAISGASASPDANNTNAVPAISLLALSNGGADSSTEVGARARLVAATLTKSFLTELPGRVFKHDNEASLKLPVASPEPRTSTVLIVSGDLEADPQHQRLRAVHVAALLSAFDALATGGYRGANPALYEQLPRSTYTSPPTRP